MYCVFVSPSFLSGSLIQNKCMRLSRKQPVSMAVAESSVYNCVAVRRASGRTHLLDEVIKTNMMDQSIFAFLRIVLLPSHSASDEKLHSVFLRAQQI